MKKTLLLSLALFPGVLFAEENLAESFPAVTLDLPALSLSESARVAGSAGKLGPMVPFHGHATPVKPPVVPADKFVISPSTGADYKLLIKKPDAAVDYKLIVKNPDTPPAK